MDIIHLEHIFHKLEGKEKNYWNQGYTTGIHNAWMRTVRNSGYKYEIRRQEKSKPYISLMKEDGFVIGEVTPWKLPTCSKLASRICADKIATQQYLENAKINIPQYSVFEEGEEEDALSFAFDGREEVVVKAYSFSQGLGVYLNVDEERFIRSFQECILLQKEKRRKPKVMVQEMVRGFELRVMIVEGNFFGAVVRIPAYVTGDGLSSIKQLIEKKNLERQNCRALKSRSIKITENLKAYMFSKGISIEHVPVSGERVLLSSISNISFGVETANVTDLVSEEIKNIAYKAVASIPGLYTAGVDIMVSSPPVSG